VSFSSRAIRPHRGYPVLRGEEIIDYSFVRETETNLYIQENLNADDFIRKLIPPPTPSTDVFELSVFLYGYYNKKHIGIRKPGTFFLLFLLVKKLYKRTILYQGENYTLSFSHCPTRLNYWHFQLYTVDNIGNKIPRGTKKPRYKNLARFIAREYIKRAICKESDAIPFHRSDFDKKIKPVQYFFRHL